MRTEVKSVLGIVVVVSLLLVCSTHEENPDDISFANADGYNGGQLYDEFYAEGTGFDQTVALRYEQNGDFFRCVMCHGWDLLGQQGGFAQYYRSNSTPNVVNINLYETVKTSSGSDVFNAIKTGADPAKRRDANEDLLTYDTLLNNAIGDRMPDYSQILTDAQIWDLVKFLKTESIDVRLLYDYLREGSYPNATVTYSSIGKDGNAVQGDSIYSRQCSSSSCHGADGTENAGMFTVGKYLRSMPYREAYLIKFGVLGTGMGKEVLTAQQQKNLFKALADTLKYP